MPEEPSAEPSLESDDFAQAVLANLRSASAPSAAPPPSGVGWIFGGIVGILIALWMFPAARNTLASQFQFALIADNLPWLRALDARRQDREVTRLDAIAARLPDDYLLQIGRATILADVSLRRAQNPNTATKSLPSQEDDRTLLRLGILARKFPLSGGAYAHLTRYMMGERVKIRRKETDNRSQLRTEHCAPTDFHLMEWAIRNGEVCDPDNAFWSAMLAVACFASGKDAEALTALEKASRKHKWDAYLYEEVLGQWRLYSAAYGDNGAAQKIAPLSLLAFPHLQELRQMAYLVCWRSDMEALHGNIEKALKLRRQLAWLGILLRDNAQWAYEALYGTDMLFIATTDRLPTSKTNLIQEIGQWQEQSKGYRKLLQQARRQSDSSYFYNEAQTSCQLRQRVEQARTYSSGLPLGIPLRPLFGSWMLGVCMIQQALALLTLALCGWRWRVWLILTRHPLHHFCQTLGFVVPILLIAGASLSLSYTEPNAQLGLFGVLGVLLLLAHVFQRLWRSKEERKVWDFSEHWVRAEIRWQQGTTVRMALLLTLPMGILLYISHDTLSDLHPVSVILSSPMEYSRSITPLFALYLTLLFYGVPLLLLLVSGLWGLWRRQSPVATLLMALQRLTLPLVSILLLAYLILMNQTLSLDSNATRAINEAAEHDLHWILTHSGTGGEQESED